MCICLGVIGGNRSFLVILRQAFSVFMIIREVSFFTRRGGGLLKIGGDQVLCLRSKGGIKRFFQIKRGDQLYFLKK